MLNGITTSIRKTLLSKKGVKSDKAAEEFLKKPNFHQKLRKEILFALMPRTLSPNTPEERESQKSQVT